MFIPKSLDEEIILLMYKVHRHIRREITCEDDSHQPTMLQLQALQYISAQKTTMRHIADELGVAFPTATSMIDRLVKAEYVTREVDKNDRRVVYVSLTDKGQTVLNTMLRKKMEHMHLMLTKISEDDKKTMHRIFSDLLKKLDKNS